MRCDDGGIGALNTSAPDIIFWLSKQNGKADPGSFLTLGPFAGAIPGLDVDCDRVDNA